jgi:hypothetical protein
VRDLLRVNGIASPHQQKPAKMRGFTRSFAASLTLSAAYRRVFLNYLNQHDHFFFKPRGNALISTTNFRKKIQMLGARNVAPNDNIVVNGRGCVCCSPCTKRRVSDRRARSR